MRDDRNCQDADEPITRLNGLVIDLRKVEMNSDTTRESVPNPPMLNGHSVTLDNQHSILDRRANKLEPLQEVTNTNASTQPAASDIPTNKMTSSSDVFKIPALPIRKGSPVPDDTLPHIKAPLPHELNPIPKLRRWSSASIHPQNTPRRNSFPGTRKDGLEELQQLKAETKLAKEKTAAISITNGTLPTLRKNSVPSPVTGSILSAGGGLGEGYFNVKPDSRGRSTTTPGILPTPGVIPVRRGSFFAENRPLVTPRLETLRRDSSRLDGLPTTLWDYLMIEMENFEPQGVEDYKKERLSNFLRIPQTFEKVRDIWRIVLIVVNLVWMGCLF